MVRVQERNKARPFSEKALQALVLVFGIATLVVPPLVLATSGTATTVPSWSAARLLAMLAFTLIFMQIITGATRRLLNRLFPPVLVQRVHVATGLCGFILALIHGVLVLAYSFQKGHSVVWVIGPVTLALLAVTVAAALERKRLGSTWRWIHRLNYLIFVAVFLKTVAIGTDFKTSAALRMIFYAYVAIAGLAFAYRLVELERMKRKVKGRKDR